MKVRFSQVASIYRFFDSCGTIGRELARCRALPYSSSLNDRLSRELLVRSSDLDHRLEVTRFERHFYTVVSGETVRNAIRRSYVHFLLLFPFAYTYTYIRTYACTCSVAELHYSFNSRCFVGRRDNTNSAAVSRECESTFFFQGQPTFLALITSRDFLDEKN